MGTRLFFLSLVGLFVFTLFFAWKVVKLTSENKRYRG